MHVELMKDTIQVRCELLMGQGTQVLAQLIHAILNSQVVKAVARQYSVPKGRNAAM